MNLVHGYGGVAGRSFNPETFDTSVPVRRSLDRHGRRWPLVWRLACPSGPWAHLAHFLPTDYSILTNGLQSTPHPWF